MNLKEIFFLGLVASVYTMCGGAERSATDGEVALGNVELTSRTPATYAEPTAYLAPRPTDAVFSVAEVHLQVPSI